MNIHQPIQKGMSYDDMYQLVREGCGNLFASILSRTNLHIR